MLLFPERITGLNSPAAFFWRCFLVYFLSTCDYRKSWWRCCFWKGWFTL